MTSFSQRIEPLSSDTVFTEMNRLSAKYRSINLGHGFPDFAAPQFVKEAATWAIQHNINQYTSVLGNLKLRRTIAGKMLAQHGQSYCPDTEITITQGATEAISAAISGLLNPGDEVVLFEPCYSTYVPTIAIAGGTPRCYPLSPPNWSIDEERLRALFSDKTKLLLVNTPHNPTGKVFSDRELSFIGGLCHEYDVLALSDEVYEHLTFDQHQHRPLSSYPGMRDRTITVSSFGKTFEVTGWKIGWTLAPPELTQAIVKIRQYSTGSGAAPLQAAAAKALMDIPQQFYTQLQTRYQRNRDRLYEAIARSGLTPFLPEGTCFLLADCSHFDVEDDVEFCRYLTKTAGITAIPASALYHSAPKNTKLVRFAFCKQEATLAEAERHLTRLKSDTLLSPRGAQSAQRCLR